MISSPSPFWQEFLLCASTDTHTALRARSWKAFIALSLSFHKERAKEREPRLSPLEPPISRRSDDERRGFCFCKRPPSWAHISHAQDGFAVGRFFAFCSYLRSYCATVSRAEREVFHATSWCFPRSSQEGNLDVPSKTSLPPAVLRQTAGVLLWQKSSILGAYIARPRWVCRWKDLSLPRRGRGTE